MKALELKIPPVFVFFVAVLGMYVATLSNAMQIPFQGYDNVVGRLFIGLGALIGVLGVVTFKRAKTTVNPVNIHNTSSLVTHGIYQYSRNPMYVGLVFILLGIACHWNANMLISAVVLLCFIAYMNVFQIIPEERMLAKLFNEEFEAYKNTTRRWL